MIKVCNSYNFYKIIVLLFFIDSMYPWYMWGNIVSPITFVATALLSFILLFKRTDLFEVTYANIGMVGCIGIYMIYMLLQGGAVGVILRFFIWGCLIFLRSYNKQDILNFITKWFAILLAISLIFYLLWLLNIFAFNPQYIEWQNERYYYYNYYLFVVSVNYVDADNFLRFMSIFMEPGHLTMGIVPLLICNRFNFRNIYVVILFIAELFTFSLAGYVCMAIGYVLWNLNIKGGIYYLARGFAIVIALIVILDKVGYSEMLDQFLWKRLEITDSGKLAGDNRTTDMFNRQYEWVIHSSDKWTGLDNYTQDYGDGGNAGYKVFIVKYGYLGLACMLLCYTFYFLFYKRYALVVFTMILLLLLYQSGDPLWFNVMCLYVLGSSVLRYKPTPSKNKIESSY